MEKLNRPISIGKLSSRSGCKIETIRYYETQGLMPAPARTPGGHRQYTDSLQRRLLFIRRSRALGFSMLEIRQLLTLMDGDEISCEQVRAIAHDHLHDIRDRIAGLKKMESTLANLASQCSGRDDSECPIIDDLTSGSIA